jgi:hypothetical protein
LKEKDVQKAVLEFLALKKIWAWRNNTGAFTGEYNGKKRFHRFGAVGSPDVFAVLPSGKVMHIECKGDKGKLSPAQEEWQEKAVKHGHYYIVCRDVSELFPFFGGVK